MIRFAVQKKKDTVANSKKYEHLSKQKKTNCQQKNGKGNRQFPEWIQNPREDCPRTRNQSGTSSGALWSFSMLKVNGLEVHTDGRSPGQQQSGGLREWVTLGEHTGISGSVASHL
jgi:hypothetical protein